MIRQHLRDCEVFLPLLTTHFHESYWTDQETGIAVAHRKFILPLKVDVNPYGFISEIQALRIGKSIGDSCWKIARALAAEPDFSREVRSAVIEMFAASGSFDETPLIATRLAELRPFSNSEARAIVAGSANNQNIYGCWAVRDFVNGVIQKASRLDSSLVREFRARVKEWDSR